MRNAIGDQLEPAHGEDGNPVKESQISLAGEWRFALDPSDAGLAEEWFSRSFDDKIHLPGSLQTQGCGDEVSVDTHWVGMVVDKSWYTSPEFACYREPGNLKIPFWLQPAMHYVGAAWYRRDVVIPEGWCGRRVRLILERVHISSKVWLDGIPMGRDDSLSTAHVHDLGVIAPGLHTLTLRVDNRLPANVGENAHCVTDHAQTNWNGVIGRLVLEAVPETWLDGVEAYPDVLEKRVRVTWRLGGVKDEGRITLRVLRSDGEEYSVETTAAAGEAVICLGDHIELWDEFSPKLYRIKVRLNLSDGSHHTIESTFGMVDYRTEGRHFLVNGRRTLFRGTIDCASYPLTGYPSTDVSYWRNQIAVVKAHGLNHLRFHSWCPPEAAFIAADELGCYLLVEHAWTIPDKAADYLMREAERVVRAYGNHPSFAMHTHGNEPVSGKAWMEQFVAHFRQRDPRRYYAGATGWPMLQNNQYHARMDGLRVNPWGAGLDTSLNRQAPATTDDFRARTESDPRPFIAHETGQWCVYPDFDEIGKYSGFLKAKNFELFCDLLDVHHMGDQARDFVKASGRLQTLCYKYEIEKILRSPGIGGFQLLGLNDFPGQGTAPVGAVNIFWETKSYTTPDEYRCFAGPSVLLARLAKMVFTTEDVLVADLEISHYAATPLRQARIGWMLVDGTGRTVRAGELAARDIPVGQSLLGRLELPLAGLVAPGQFKLVVCVVDTDIENAWDLWIYQNQTAPPDPGNVVISRDPADAWSQAAAGASVLLIPPAASIADPDGPPVALGFSTIFWNTAWTKRQPPTTMGILCDPAHPALAEFPTESHTNYQWWYLLQRAAKPLSLEGQDPKMRPVVQVIDDWFTARRLGLVVEARCGAGKLLISAMDLDGEGPHVLVATQFLSSLLAYMSCPAFAPTHELDQAAYARFFQHIEVAVT